LFHEGQKVQQARTALGNLAVGRACMSLEEVATSVAETAGRAPSSGRLAGDVTVLRTKIRECYIGAISNTIAH
jgi:hypothetical protein